MLGGYKVQGKRCGECKKLIEDAKKCEEAGAIALVLECVPMQLAELISEQLTIPTIGIGAGQKVDGQVLVYHDLYLIRRKSCSEICEAIYVCSRGDCAWDFTICY